ncbi:hypothetical protein CEXT_586181 [Caerostris extrusa]|uniref:Uncharacterized protein n=1 Tax=Caerostris extrusa TaxID=172846 RepID=A0AAV4MN70_CAEEX|nr:hypothetical protein CEXT_586181 [Caerostris extrusa]
MIRNNHWRRKDNVSPPLTGLCDAEKEITAYLLGVAMILRHVVTILNDRTVHLFTEQVATNGGNFSVELKVSQTTFPSNHPNVGRIWTARERLFRTALIWNRRWWKIPERRRCLRRRLMDIIASKCDPRNFHWSLEGALAEDLRQEQSLRRTVRLQFGFP